MEHLKQYFTTSYWVELIRSFIHALGTKKFWKELLLMTLGMSLGAAAVYYFLMPSHLIVGSISGLSIVLNTLFGGTADTFSYWVMGINAFLLLLAFILIGNEFGAKTVYTAMILGPLTQLWDRICPNYYFTHQAVTVPDEIMAQLQAGQTVLDANNNPYIISRTGEVMERVRDSVMSGSLGTGDVWFDLICFVLLLSICQAVLFRINASTGGLDILGKIVNKYLHFDIGTSVAIGGIIICCTAFLINDFRMVVIGIIGTWINGLAIDYFTASLNKRKRVCIVSNDSERVRKYIVETLIRGCSIYKIEGGYSREEHMEIQTLLTQDEFSSLMAFIRNNHIKAFITAGNCSEVYGLWLRHKKKDGKTIVVND
ncbi:MAG: YitT family protein [Paludibacteraceae bacterium]|nr:YitT family protein [Paludibacteraceae bacterium]MBQ2519780.1 YitT family protein [Paludibacteraceae bacterium]MBR6166871.1 YitT family protein [Paludibacteraceae bacterium]